MSREALVELLAKVEAGEWDFRSDAPARQVFPYKSSSADDLGLTARAAFEGSLDAAKALHEAVLPGWPVKVTMLEAGLCRVWTDRRSGLRQMGFNGECNERPARSWLCAILKALIAEAEE